MNINFDDINPRQGSLIMPIKTHAIAFAAKHLGIDLNDVRFACFLTGSVAFEEQKAGSDIDLVLPITVKQSTLLKLDNTGFKYQSSDYNEGVHGFYETEVGFIEINVLFLHPLDFVCWKRAGEMYKVLPHSPDREARHALFELLRATVKTSLRLANIFVNSKNFHMY